MKIVFFGSGRFGVAILKAIHLYGHDISLVVTQPDRKKGRHLHLAGTPVKEYALLCGLKIFQPEDVNQPASVEILKKQEVDIFLVVSYGRILSKEIISLPKKICINIHASLLPKYRGAAPISRVLMNGERKTGVTFIRMNEHMDRGDIIFQKAIKINITDHSISLEDKLSKLASDYINKILENVKNNKIKFNKQKGKYAPYAPLLKKYDGLIHWNYPAEKIYNHFRGCFGWPGSFTTFKGKILKILGLNIARGGFCGRPGEIIRAEDNLLEVACLRGSVLIQEVLPESHNRMSVKSFLAGHRVRVGDMLGD